MEASESQDQPAHFLNSTGVPVRQIFSIINYRVPGKVYPSITFNRKESHSLLTYAHRLLSFLLSIQLKNLVSAITFQQKKTLHSAYKRESLAILSNSIDLHAAICKAQEYNIPLFQLCILSQAGEKIVREKLLLNFTISHFINQNFVLYGDWEERKEIFECLQEDRPKVEGFDSREGFFFRKGELVYAFISLAEAAEAHDHLLQENLTKVRNMFYLLDNEKQAKASEPEMELSPQPSSELQNELSLFGAMGGVAPNEQQQMEEFLDNFNDSDNQMEPQR